MQGSGPSGPTLRVSAIRCLQLHSKETSTPMNTSEQILHDRVNLVRLVRRLDKSANEFNWGSESNSTSWFRSEGLLQVSLSFSLRTDINN
jgi:hypothetical protein